MVFVLRKRDRTGIETSQEQPQHKGGVLAWWFSSSGISYDRARSCLWHYSPALFIRARLWSQHHHTIHTTLYVKTSHQPTRVCFPGRTGGMYCEPDPFLLQWDSQLIPLQCFYLRCHRLKDIGELIINWLQSVRLLSGPPYVCFKEQT